MTATPRTWTGPELCALLGVAHEDVGLHVPFPITRPGPGRPHQLTRTEVAGALVLRALKGEPGRGGGDPGKAPAWFGHAARALAIEYADPGPDRSVPYVVALWPVGEGRVAAMVPLSDEADLPPVLAQAERASHVVTLLYLADVLAPLDAPS